MAVLVSAAKATMYANQRKIVRLSDGTLYCVYTNPDRDIYIKKSTDNGATWTGETLVSTLPGMDTTFQVYPSIAVDSSDHLHVVWSGQATGFGTYEIWYNKYDGAWAGPVRISTYAGMDVDHQRTPSIAVDGSDNLHVVWDGQATGFGTAEQIWYVKYDGAWSDPVRISTYAGMESYLQSEAGIAIDSSDNLHVVWYGQATGFITANQIWYSKYTDVWADPVRISTYAGMEVLGNDRPSIAIDSNDYIHIAWYGLATGFTTISQIWYNKYDGAWAGPVRISTYDGMETYNQTMPSIAVDSSDDVYVVFQGKATLYIDFNKIWYAKYETSWGTPELLQDMGEIANPNIRWSRYPSSNIPAAGVDYVFNEGALLTYWDKVESPFPVGKDTQTMGRTKGFDFRGKGFRI